MTFYIIDFDTRTVESKSEDEDQLAGYILDNDLDMAVALIGNAEDLEEQLSQEELSDLYGHFNGNPPKWSDIKDASADTWDTIEYHKTGIPTFTKALGKRLLKAGNTPEPKTETTSKPKAPKQNKGIRASELVGMIFCCTDKSPRNGTSFSIITNFIDENLGEGTFEELVSEFTNKYIGRDNKTRDKKFAIDYIRGSFNQGYIEETL